MKQKYKSLVKSTHVFVCRPHKSRTQKSNPTTASEMSFDSFPAITNHNVVSQISLRYHNSSRRSRIWEAFGRTSGSCSKHKCITSWSWKNNEFNLRKCKNNDKYKFTITKSQSFITFNLSLFWDNRLVFKSFQRFGGSFF